MWKNIFVVIYIITAFFAYYYLFRVYKDTNTDPFKENFGYEEKKHYFKYLMDYEDYMTSREFNCKKFQDLILKPQTKKLEDVFKLNISLIHVSLYFMLIFLFVFLVMILLSCLCFKLMQLFIQILGVANLIIFFTAIMNFNNGNINDYYEFLSCKNVNYEGFDKYKSVEVLKKDFRYFTILYVLFLICSAFIPFNFSSISNTSYSY